MHKQITISPKQAKNNFVRLLAKSRNDYTQSCIHATNPKPAFVRLYQAGPICPECKPVQFCEFVNNSGSSLHCDSVVPILEYLVLA